MNKRINELAEQAGFTFYRGSIWASNPDCENDFYCDEEVKKFAELIIQECGVALSPMLRDMISRGQAYDLIKKHFGVEE